MENLKTKLLERKLNFKEIEKQKAALLHCYKIDFCNKYITKIFKDSKLIYLNCDENRFLSGADEENMFRFSYDFDKVNGRYHKEIWVYLDHGIVEKRKTYQNTFDDEPINIDEFFPIFDLFRKGGKFWEGILDEEKENELENIIDNTWCDVEKNK